MLYAPGMPFAPEDLAALAVTSEVRIETTAADGSTHRTVIWVVVDGPDAFVRSWRGETARWYREALTDPRVAVLVDGRRIACRAVSATDPDSVERTSAGFRTKYAGDPAADAMVHPAILSTTLRLEPA